MIRVTVISSRDQAQTGHKNDDEEEGRSHQHALALPAALSGDPLHRLPADHAAGAAAAGKKEDQPHQEHHPDHDPDPKPTHDGTDPHATDYYRHLHSAPATDGRATSDN